MHRVPLASGSEGTDAATLRMRSESDIVAADCGDEFATHGCGPRTSERAVRRNPKKECSTTILHVNNKPSRRIFHHVRRLCVSFTAVENDRVVLELYCQSSVAGVAARHTKAS